MTEEANGSYLYFRLKDQTEEPVLNGHVKTLPASSTHPSRPARGSRDTRPVRFTPDETYLFEKNPKNRCKKAIHFRLRPTTWLIARRFPARQVVTSYASA